MDIETMPHAMYFTGDSTTVTKINQVPYQTIEYNDNGMFTAKLMNDLPIDERSHNLQLTVLYMSLKLPHFAHYNVVRSLTSRVQLCCIQYRMCGYGLISRANYRLVSHV